MDHRSTPNPLKFSLHAALSALIFLGGLAGCSSLEAVPPGDTPLLVTTTTDPASQLSPLAFDASNPYLITTTSNLWERLGADFGLNQNLPTLATEEPPQEKDLWERLRAGFILPHRQHPKARKEAQYYASYQEHLDETVNRAQPYLYYVLEAIEKRGMPSEIALLPIIESAYRPLARSSGGAVGIWQFIPSTGKNFGLKQNFWYDGRRDIAASTNAAMNYLQKLNIDFDGDWLLALAAYNSGEGTVLRAMKKNRAAGKPTDFWSLDLPKETEAYIPRLLGVAALVADPAEFGATLNFVADAPYLTSIDLDSQVDLNVAAQMADITPQEIQILNPGFIHGTSDPKGPHQLLLPLDKMDIFNAKLASLEPGNLMPPKAVSKASRKNSASKKSAKSSRLNESTTDESVAGKTGDNGSKNTAVQSVLPSTLGIDKAGGTPLKYKVREGDSLSRIAQRYKVTLTQLREWNADKLTGEVLIPGHHLKLYINPNLAIETIK
ncbi:MAG: transglycosylase SLT domain-containing protein [Gammaproteobacteria bacterium]